MKAALILITIASAVVTFSWIQSLLCCDLSKDMEGLLHIFQPHVKEKGTDNYNVLFPHDEL